jgi:hypothetical protein
VASAPPRQQVVEESHLITVEVLVLKKNRLKGCTMRRLVKADQRCAMKMSGCMVK